MTTPAHPQDFYIAHRVYTFSRNHQPVTEWGAMTDGPEDREGILERVTDWMKEARSMAWPVKEAHEPSLATLRVWHFQADVPARDVTEDILGEVENRLEEMTA